MAGVRPRPGNQLLGDSRGAYVNVLALANDEPQFVEKATLALSALGFDIFEVEDVEPLQDRATRVLIDDELIRLAEEVRASGETQLGTFHAFQADDS